MKQDRNKLYYNPLINSSEARESRRKERLHILPCFDILSETIVDFLSGVKSVQFYENTREGLGLFAMR